MEHAPQYRRRRNGPILRGMANKGEEVLGVNPGPSGSPISKLWCRSATLAQLRRLEGSKGSL